MRKLFFLHACLWVTSSILHAQKNIFSRPLGTTTVPLSKTSSMLSIAHGHTAHEESTTISTLLRQTTSQQVNPTFLENVFCACAYFETPKGPDAVGILFYRHSEKDPRTVIVRYLSVAAHHQKKGIGTHLIQYVAHTTRCRAIELFALPSSLGFYDKLNFRMTCIPFWLRKSY